MSPDPDAMAAKVALDLFAAGQPLASALVGAELIRGGVSTPMLWCALGTALMASRGQLVRQPFEAWAALVFRRGLPESYARLRLRTGQEDDPGREIWRPFQHGGVQEWHRDA